MTLDRNVAEVVTGLTRNLKSRQLTFFDMVVRSGHVLTDALRRMDKVSFDPTNPIKVCYINL